MSNLTILQGLSTEQADVFLRWFADVGYESMCDWFNGMDIDTPKLKSSSLITQHASLDNYCAVCPGDTVINFGEE